MTQQQRKNGVTSPLLLVPAGIGIGFHKSTGRAMDAPKPLVEPHLRRQAKGEDTLPHESDGKKYFVSLADKTPFFSRRNTSFLKTKRFHGLSTACAYVHIHKIDFVKSWKFWKNSRRSEKVVSIVSAIWCSTHLRPNGVTAVLLFFVFVLLSRRYHVFERAAARGTATKKPGTVERCAQNEQNIGDMHPPLPPPSGFCIQS